MEMSRIFVKVKNWVHYPKTQMARISVHSSLSLQFNDQNHLIAAKSQNPFKSNADSIISKKISLLENPFCIYKTRVRTRSSGLKSVELLNRYDDRNDEKEEEEEELGFDEFGNDDLSYFRGLVLDIAYRPVNVVCWRRALCLEYTEKVDVLEYYDKTVSSVQGTCYLPAVLRVPHLLQAVKRRRIKHTLCRKSIYYRDSYTCQYCCSKEKLTIDHVLPISLGGEWSWDNLVTACSRCNSQKGQKTMEEANMNLIKKPKAPKDFDLIAIPLTMDAIKVFKKREGIPVEWQQYIGQ